MQEDTPSKPLTAKDGFTFGCDPEGFVFDTATGKPVPAVGLIPGTKDEPHKVKCGAVQVDGMAAEFNIDPVRTYAQWEKNITTVIEELKGFLPKGLELRFLPTVTFDPEVFDPLPEYTKDLGCQPDFDAWEGGVNPPPDMEAYPYTRCAGGHIHFGWTRGEDLGNIQHLLNCQDLVKQLDWVLGGWSATKDPDITRRMLYGKMGACRYKDYGVEYRVLSNFWLVSKELRLEVWNRMNHAVNVMSQLFIPDRTLGYVPALREFINKRAYDADLDYVGKYPIHTLNTAARRF